MGRRTKGTPHKKGQGTRRENSPKRGSNSRDRVQESGNEPPVGRLGASPPTVTSSQGAGNIVPPAQNEPTNSSIPRSIPPSNQRPEDRIDVVVPQSSQSSRSTGRRTKSTPHKKEQHKRTRVHSPDRGSTSTGRGQISGNNAPAGRPETASPTSPSSQRASNIVAPAQNAPTDSSIPRAVTPSNPHPEDRTDAAVPEEVPRESRQESNQPQCLHCTFRENRENHRHSSICPDCYLRYEDASSPTGFTWDVAPTNPQTRRITYLGASGSYIRPYVRRQVLENQAPDGRLGTTSPTLLASTSRGESLRTPQQPEQQAGVPSSGVQSGHAQLVRISPGSEDRRKIMKGSSTRGRGRRSGNREPTVGTGSMSPQAQLREQQWGAQPRCPHCTFPENKFHSRPCGLCYLRYVNVENPRQWVWAPPPTGPDVQTILATATPAGYAVPFPVYSPEPVQDDQTRQPLDQPRHPRGNDTRTDEMPTPLAHLPTNTRGGGRSRRSKVKRPTICPDCGSQSEYRSSYTPVCYNNQCRSYLTRIERSQNVPSGSDRSSQTSSVQSGARRTTPSHTVTSDTRIPHLDHDYIDTRVSRGGPLLPQVQSQSRQQDEPRDSRGSGGHGPESHSPAPSSPSTSTASETERLESRLAAGRGAESPAPSSSSSSSSTATAPETEGT